MPHKEKEVHDDTQSHVYAIALVMLILLGIQLMIAIKCSVPGMITVFNRLFHPGKMPANSQAGLVCQFLGVMLFVSIMSHFIKVVKA